MNIKITDASIEAYALNETLQSVFAGDMDALITHCQTVSEEIKQELEKIAPEHPFYKWCLDNFLLFHYNVGSGCLETDPHTTPLNYHFPLIFRADNLSLRTNDEFQAIIWLKTDRIYQNLSLDTFSN